MSGNVKISECARVSARACMHRCVCMCECTCMCTSVPVCVCAWVWACTCVHARACVKGAVRFLERKVSCEVFSFVYSWCDRRLDAMEGFLSSWEVNRARLHLKCFLCSGLNAFGSENVGSVTFPKSWHWQVGEDSNGTSLRSPWSCCKGLCWWSSRQHPPLSQQTDVNLFREAYRYLRRLRGGRTMTGAVPPALQSLPSPWRALWRSSCDRTKPHSVGSQFFSTLGIFGSRWLDSRFEAVTVSPGPESSGPRGFTSQAVIGPYRNEGAGRDELCHWIARWPLGSHSISWYFSLAVNENENSIYLTVQN